jgi:hypothetical protein
MEWKVFLMTKITKRQAKVCFFFQNPFTLFLDHTLTRVAATDAKKTKVDAPAAPAAAAPAPAYAYPQMQCVLCLQTSVSL